MAALHRFAVWVALSLLLSVHPVAANQIGASFGPDRVAAHDFSPTSFGPVPASTERGIGPLAQIGPFPGVVPLPFFGGKLSCTGGTITTSGGNTIHAVTASGNLVCTGASGTATALIVAGGGSGATGQAGGFCAGGGGAGDYLPVGSFTLSPGTYPIVIGAGGAAVVGSVPGSATDGNDGNDSSFNGNTATKGGGGGKASAASASNGRAGGSGGGGGSSSGGGSATGGSTSGSGTHNVGGNGTLNNSGRPGTGGGSTAAGANNQPCSTALGGVGTSNSISGAAVVYAQGGGIAADNVSGTAGATPGSGGQSASGGAAVPNSGAGATGIVIVSYPTP